MADSDLLITGRRPDDVTSIIMDMISHVQFKFVALMFLMFIFLSSDVFINRILATFKGAVNQKTPTTYGTTLNGLFLVIAMIIIDAFIGQKII